MGLYLYIATSGRTSREAAATEKHLPILSKNSLLLKKIKPLFINKKSYQAFNFFSYLNILDIRNTSDDVFFFDISKTFYSG